MNKSMSLKYITELQIRVANLSKIVNQQVDLIGKLYGKIHSFEEKLGLPLSYGPLVKKSKESNDSN